MFSTFETLTYMKIFKRYLSPFVHLLFAPACAGCQEEVVDPKAIFCADCLSVFPYARNLAEVDNPFEQHFTGRAMIQAGGSLCHFTKGGMIQRALHQLKYRNQPHIGFALGKMLGHEIRRAGRFDTVNVIAAVPLHPKKKMRRGYNQADYIARGVAASLRVDYVKDMILRVTNNQSQTRKSRINRMKNVGKAFQLNAGISVDEKHVLLVDDVLTSGATLDFCAQTLLRNGNCKVSMATIAMGAPV